MVKGVLKYDAIVIGGSSGGTQAIISLLSKIPADFRIPLIIVLHRQRRISDNLAEVIQFRCKIKVKNADEKEPIMPGFAYLAPPNYHLLIEEDKTFSVTTEELVNYSRPSIDVLFECASDVFGKKLIGIILTGSNADGSAGLKAIHNAGGLTIVQDPKTAESGIMPEHAIKATKVDYVLTLAEIQEFLIKLKE